VSSYFEIAYATACERLCLFTGTGFSKAVTANAAPSWQALLEACCDDLKNGATLKASLFSGDPKNRLTLEEAAQVVAIEREGAGVSSIHERIAEIIGALSPTGDNAAIQSFLTQATLAVVTTNYDKLLEGLMPPSDYNSISPGLPIPRTAARVSVYHVHGSIDEPSNMVVTSDNYFAFMRSETYLSRKLSTLLHEDTVVILGYSLGDTNLRAILNDYRGFTRDQVIGGSIFLVSKDPVGQHAKDYYSYCYGIRVLDSTTVSDFFSGVMASLPTATACRASSQDSVRKVLDEGAHFTDNYLRLRSSFFEIVAAVRAIGRSIDNPRVVETLGAVITKKIEFTGINGAWEQYEHLASWLVYLGSILELRGTSIEEPYLHAVRRSMTTMSRGQALGYSWQAYTVWRRGWFELSSANRALVREFISTTAGHDPDAMDIVTRTSPE